MSNSLQIKNIKQTQHPFHVLTSSKLSLIIYCLIALMASISTVNIRNLYYKCGELSFKTRRIATLAVGGAVTPDAGSTAFAQSFGMVAGGAVALGAAAVAVRYASPRTYSAFLSFLNASRGVNITHHHHNYLPPRSRFSIYGENLTYVAAAATIGYTWNSWDTGSGSSSCMVSDSSSTTPASRAAVAGPAPRGHSSTSDSLSISMATAVGTSTPISTAKSEVTDALFAKGAMESAGVHLPKQ